MLFLYCLVLREANKCNAQKPCGANRVRVKFILRKSYLLINLKLFFSRPEGFLYIWCMFCHSDHNVTLLHFLFPNRTCSCSVSHTNADVLAVLQCLCCRWAGQFPLLYFQFWECGIQWSTTNMSAPRKPNPSRVVFHCSRGILRDESILRYLCESVNRGDSRWLICSGLILTTFIFWVTIFQVHLIFTLFF